MKIREARASDKTAIMSLAIAVSVKHWDAKPGSARWVKAVSELKKEIDDAIRMSNKAVYVAEYSWGVVGFIIASKMKMNHPVCRITWASVLPAMQGAGIGKKLFDKALAWAKANKSEMLVVYASRVHKQAIPFWEKMGFKLAKTQLMERKI